MYQSKKQTSNQFERRKRLHELLIALIKQQADLELMDEEGPRVEGTNLNCSSPDPAQWLDRNRRVLKRYQALVRSAITLDALLDAEQNDLG